MCATVILALAATALAGPMEDEQLWTLPERSETIHPRLGTLMKGALGEPTQLARIKAMSEVARYKLTDLTDDVAALLDDPSEMIQTSALLTLDALDAKEQADKIMAFATTDQYTPDNVEQMQLADAMLARWKHGAAITVWSGRVTDAAAPSGPRISAARALATAGAADAPGLGTVVSDRAALFTLRLAAADAMAGSPEALPSAKQLAETDPLIAAHLLARADSEPAIETLKKLAANDNSAVQRVALTRLVELNDQNIAPFAADALKSADPSVRLIPAEALAKVTTPESVDLLLATLDDEHPDVRNAARESLATLAKTESLNSRIDAGIMAILDRAIADPAAGPTANTNEAVINAEMALAQAKNAKPNDTNLHNRLENELKDKTTAYDKARAPLRWREAEQAAILAGVVDHKPAADKLTRLFDYPRLEVRIGTMAGLRPLAVESTYPKVADLAKTVFDRLERRSAGAKKEAKGMFRGEQVAVNDGDSAFLSEIAQTLGVWKYEPAHTTLRRGIPKDSAPTSHARSACIWALGWIYEDSQQEKLARELILRVFDLNPNNPEAEDVRVQCMVAIGRMRDKSQLQAGVRGKLEGDSLDIRAAARWALKRITGEDAPPIVLEPAVRSDAFISPLR